MKLNLREIQAALGDVAKDERPELRRRSDWRRERDHGHDPGRMSRAGPVRGWRASDAPPAPLDGVRAGRRHSGTRPVVTPSK